MRVELDPGLLYKPASGFAARGEHRFQPSLVIMKFKNNYNRFGACCKHNGILIITYSYKKWLWKYGMCFLITNFKVNCFRKIKKGICLALF